MKLGFIGAGNMAGAIINGLINSGFPARDISAYDVIGSKLEPFKAKGVAVSYTSASSLAAEADIIVLAVKPSVVPVVLDGLYKSGNAKGKILVSIAAGISSAFIKEHIGEGVKVVRVMPNTPAMVGEGMTVVCKTECLTDKELEDVKSIFKSVGKVEVLEEKMIDAVTAVSGSGPAYVSMVIEALADGGVMCGLPRDKAYLLAAQTVLGTSKMVLDAGLHPAVIKDMVSSPAGTTIEGVRELEMGGARAAFISAVVSSAKRSAELGRK